MRHSGKISAAIEILADFEARHVPLKTCLQDWGRGHRFAGSGDRAWISGLCLDALRHRRSIAALMAGDSPRAAILGTLHRIWGWPVADIAEAVAEEPHGPGPLTACEREELGLGRDEVLGEAAVQGDFPDWLTPSLRRVFGDDLVPEMQAMAARAPVDLRVNTLKADREKALKALSALGAEPVDVLETALRMPAPRGDKRTPSLAGATAYEKGWVEVQDLGSQLAALAAGDITGKQVLDFCAGAGGKTLALAALMENKGQLYAWDVVARRLADLFPRAQRAGVRNLQIRSPADGASLEDLDRKMDVVFVDAPCTGSGTWRRHPDTKWRLTEAQLHRRMAEQDEVLREAARYVRPGGRLVYVTCSVLAEENEDRLAKFLGDHPGFQHIPHPVGKARADLPDDLLREAISAEGYIRLTPRTTSTDGFFIAALERANVDFG